VAPIQAMITKCRELGIQIIWLNWGFTESEVAELPAAVTHCLGDYPGDPCVPGADLGRGMGRKFIKGEWNTAVYEPLRALEIPDQDVYCSKNRTSGLWNPEQPLWKYLVSSGKSTLLFSGVNTDCCVYDTLLGGTFGGWDCVVVEDCCRTSNNYGLVPGCLDLIASAHGFVTESTSFIAGEMGESGN